jgi:hypothetical protein
MDSTRLPKYVRLTPASGYWLVAAAPATDDASAPAAGRWTARRILATAPETIRPAPRMKPAITRVR